MFPYACDENSPVQSENIFELFTGYSKCYNSSQMIRTEKFCDGYWPPHCKDGSDQRHCANNNCPPGNWACLHEDDECIEPYEVCDGYYNCHDKSDEDDDFCKSWECLPTAINFHGMVLVTFYACIYILSAFNVHAQMEWEPSVKHVETPSPVQRSTQLRAEL